MSHETALETLAKGLTAADRQVLLAYMTPQHLDAGEVLLAQGEEFSGLWLVEDGQLEVYLHPDAPVVINRIGPGAWVGEVALLDPGPSTASVRAQGPTRLLYLAPGALERLREEEPRVARHVIRALGQTLARRLRMSSEKVLRFEEGGAVLSEAPRARGWFSRLVQSLVGKEAE